MALLRCFSLCGTPQTAAHQAPPSLGLSRQECWSGLPFPSPVHEKRHYRNVKEYLEQLYTNRIRELKTKWTNSIKDVRCAPSLSRVQLFEDPMNCSSPGSSVHGIFQARCKIPKLIQEERENLEI